MLRSIVIISLTTSIFLFKLGVPRAALVPLLISMYLIFTDGRIEKHDKERQFSKYHILFLLRCTIIIWVTLLLHTIGVPMLTILLVILGFHMAVIWLTLLGEYKDEFTMFHIGYYFVACILARYIPIQYGLQSGIVAWLLFPIVTFLLYAGWSFFINPFMPLSAHRHYRTGIFFVISFLSSTILYFFSAPLIGWTSWLLFYTAIVWFLAYQYKSHLTYEKNIKVYAEDILAGKTVIQPKDSRKTDIQSSIYKAIRNIPTTWRGPLVWWWVIFLLGSFISAFNPESTLPAGVIFLILCFAVFLYYDSVRQWDSVSYPTTGALAVLWLFMHGIFIWTIRKYIWFDNLTTCLFLTMGWTVIHHGLGIFLWWQAVYRANKRKYPLLYWYVWSTALVALGVAFFLWQVLPDASFSTGVILLYLGTVGVMIYFFLRTFAPKIIK